MRILPAWLREFVEIKADDRQLAEGLTSAGIAVESVEEEHGSTFYEMDLTTNRVDAMNHYGVAREASAIYGVELKKVEPKLSTDDLVIADAKKPVALAGVMGGFDSMITEQTKNVLIESAWFDPATVRRMGKRHAMHTDASHRFERGADWGITSLACDRVAELILESAG